VRYVMRQKLLSWGDDYVIKDEEGRERYLVDGKAISWGGQLSFQDTDGRELAFIKQKMFNLSPTYEIHRSGELAAVVQPQSFRLSVHFDQLLHDPDHSRTGDRGCNLDPQCLAIGFVDHVEGAEHSAAVERVAHEIERPHGVHAWLNEQRLPLTMRHPTPGPARQVQP